MDGMSAANLPAAPLRAKTGLRRDRILVLKTRIGKSMLGQDSLLSKYSHGSRQSRVPALPDAQSRVDDKSEGSHRVRRAP